MRKLFILISFIILYSGCKTDKAFIEKNDVFISGTEGSAFYRIPALIATNKGTLIAVCDARIERWNDAPNNIDLAMKRSFDNGKTWTPIKKIADYPGEEAAGDASFLLDKQTGKIWLFFDYIVPKEGFKPEMLKDFKLAEDYDKWRTIYFYAMTSDDDGETWSKPIDLTFLKKQDWDYLVASPGNGIQTKSGRLIMPTYSNRAHLTVNSCQSVYSDDHGKTWNIGNTIGEYNVEPQIVELEDGSLMMNVRQTKGKGHRMYTTSTDGGLNWNSMVDETNLPEPGFGVQASFIRFTGKKDGDSKNRILFSNPGTTKGREKMTIRISYDEGKTWKYSRVLHQGPASYSSMTVLPDGSIGIFYEMGEKYNFEKLSFARFNVEWLTEGRDSFNFKHK
jgi:sialidase-1